MISKNFFIFLFYLLFIFSQNLFAQNINGFEILVSKDKISSITFHSEVTNFYFDKKNSPYKVSALGKEAIMIQTSQDVTEPYILHILEGDRKHELVITYKKDIDLSQQDNDFSDLKLLSKLIKDFNSKQIANPSQNNVSKSSENSNSSVKQNNAGNDNFYFLISQADKAKKNEQFDEAKIKYEQALQINPNNNYTQTQLQEVNKLIQSRKEADYTDIITKANIAFYLDKFDEAVKYYNQALSLKPGDIYSNSQIQLIQKKIAATKIEQEKQKQDNLYNSYISAGDRAVNNNSYDAAKMAYSEALKIKPNDALASTKLNSINQKIISDSIEREREKNVALYTSFINAGNKALEEKSYDAAKSAYNEALKIKPNDAFVKAKINSIDQKIVTDNIVTEREKNEALYNNYINSGDKAFSEKLYDAAKSNYNEALNIKPEDVYAKKQVKKTDSALAELAAQAEKELTLQKNKDKENEYKSIISLADEDYKNGMYTQAKDEYNTALQINKNDLYSKNKIIQINKILADTQAKQISENEKIKQNSLNTLQYSEIITKADEAFENKDYSASKLLYAKALKYKDEQYPKVRLAQIEEAFAEISATSESRKDSVSKEIETTKKYNVLIAKARTAYNIKNYSVAKEAFVEASELKPNEAEPKMKLNEIDKIISDSLNVKILADQYDSLTATADNALATQEYTIALENYKEARKINPDQSYYLEKQINYIEVLVAKRDSVAYKEKKEKEMMSAYNSGIEALKYLRYDDAVLYFNQFIGLADSTIVVNNSAYNIDNLVNFAKTKISDIKAYIIRTKLASEKKDTPHLKINNNINSLSGVTLYYPNPKDPSLNEIYVKYISVDFNSPPAGQLWDTIDFSVENKLISREIMAEPAALNLTEGSNNLKLICENISFRETKVYFKFLIQNNDSIEFLTGSMLLSNYTKDGKIVNLLPVYIADFPIILSGKEKLVVYVTKIFSISNEENLTFEINDRLNKRKLLLNIPAAIYNQQKQ